MTRLLASLVLFLVILIGSLFAAADQAACDQAPGASRDTTVITTGYADIRAAGEAEAYDRAIDDAQRKALEEAIGTFIDAQTITENGALTTDRISGNSTGYIRSRKELKRWRDGPLAYVQLEISVALDSLKNDLLALKMTQVRMKIPRVVVCVTENSLGNRNAASGNTVSMVLHEKLAAHQFTMVRADSATEAGVEFDVLNSPADPSLLRVFIQALRAANTGDLVIVGTSTAQDAGTSNLYDSQLRSYQARVALQAIQVSDGRVLATCDMQGAAVHINAEQGCVAALKKTARAAADGLIQQVMVAWEDELQNGTLLTLQYRGLSVAEGIRFEHAVKDYLREVKEVYNKGTRDGASVCLVRFLGDAHDLAVALSAAPRLPYAVEIVAQDAASVTVNVRAK